MKTNSKSLNFPLTKNPLWKPFQNERGEWGANVMTRLLNRPVVGFCGWFSTREDCVSRVMHLKIEYQRELLDFEPA